MENNTATLLSLFPKLVLPYLMRKTILTTAVCLLFIAANGQDLEPRAYGNVPKNLNVFSAGYSYLNGNVVTDPSLPIENFTLESHNFGIGGIRTFALANKLARVQITVPYVYMDGKLTQDNGEEITGNRSGFADMRIRFGINLLGSPALDKKDFQQFKQKTIFGVSLVTSIPTGLYYEDKIINIGANRWAFKPEVGVSKRFKTFYAESYAGVWFYTNNNEFQVNKQKTQAPALSFQVHVSYYFKNQMWIGLNTNWFKGGSNKVDGVTVNDSKSDWRIGTTWSVPIAKGQSIRLLFHVGANVIGADKNSDLNYTAASLNYQYSFF